MHLLKQLNHEHVTMSSRVIANLTGKEHKHVLRDCLNMFGELDIDPEGYAQNWTHPQNGQIYIEYQLTKDLVETLITGYSIRLRFLVIKRLHELENKSVQAIPQSFAEALQLAADQAKKLELAAPKVDFYDALAERANLMNATQLAQKFKKSAVAFNKILEAFDVYNRCVKRGRVFQQWFIDQGLGELKETALGFAQPMFTTKGEQWVFNKFASEGII